MLKLRRQPSPYFLFPLTLLLVFFLASPWVSAKEPPKPKPQDWQINGIIAALDDGYDEVKGLGFDKLAEYEAKDLKAVLKKPEDIAQKAAKILKDEKVDNYVRSSAASALGNLGEAGAKFALELAKILKDEKVDASVRSSAASALGNLGEAGAKFAPDILKFLKDEKVDAFVRGSTASALGNLGEAGAKFTPELAKILKDEKVDVFVRSSVARALGNLGETEAKFASELAKILKDEKLDAYVRGSAVSALGNLGEAGAKFAPDILKFLKDEKVDKEIRRSAAYALGSLGEAGAKFAPELAKILKDEKVDAFVRGGAAYALGSLGEAGAKFAPELAKILKDEKVDVNIRSSAAEALGNLGEAGAKFAPELAKILKDEKVDKYVRGGAANALGNLGEAGAKFAPELAKILKDEKVDVSVRSGAAKALGKIIQLELKEIAIILNPIYERNQSQLEQWRFDTYFLGGGTEEVKTLLTWLGEPERKSIPKELTRDKATKTLNTFLKIWEPSKDLPGLREDLAEQISIVVSQKQVTWQPQDIFLLENLRNNLNQAGYGNKASAIESVIHNLQFWGKIYSARNIILLHIAFWLTLILFYPKSPHIQAIFFWNPWVRRILGMGYVGFLLTWVPYFRRKLLEPFKFPLLADAGLDYFNPDGYFPESNIEIPTTSQPSLLQGEGARQRGWGKNLVGRRNNSNSPTTLHTPPKPSPYQGEGLMSITQIIPKIQGQIVIEGASGLGKTMFLRHLLNNSKRTVVYLPAQKCQKGVIEAIQAKLHGQAQDTDFLRSLIYSGAIDICIDGINEVNAETRAKICQFVETNFQGNIIMTTQPLEWIPPATAKTYYIQPLTPNQIEKFLLSRVSRLPKDSPIQGKDYEEACKKFLKTVLDNSKSSYQPNTQPNTLPKNSQSNEEIIATIRILSNPMDLSLVSLMLSQNEEPNLFKLQQQQYNLMSAEYKRERGYEFPLKKFSQAVYQMRLNDESALPADEFFKELESMEDEKYKMVVSRQWMQDDEDKNMKEWYFRHDKIMEFFLVQNFIGDGDEIQTRLVDYMGDSRFRGVYFLLANLLALDDAKELREKLIQYAADTKDHTVSDTFVQLLRSR